MAILHANREQTNGMRFVIFIRTFVEEISAADRVEKSSFLIFPQITAAASRLKFLDSFSSDRGNESTANLKRNTSVVHFYCVDGTEHEILVQFFPRFQPRV